MLQLDGCEVPATLFGGVDFVSELRNFAERIVNKLILLTSSPDTKQGFDDAAQIQANNICASKVPSAACSFPQQEQVQKNNKKAEETSFGHALAGVAVASERRCVGQDSAVARPQPKRGLCVHGARVS